MHACVKLIPLLTTVIVARLGFHILNQKCYYSFIKKESPSALQRMNISTLAVSTVPKLVNGFLYIIVNNEYAYLRVFYEFVDENKAKMMLSLNRYTNAGLTLWCRELLYLTQN